MSATHFEGTKDNIFTDLGLKQPEELLARAQLLRKVGILIKGSRCSQKELAQLLGITQPKVSMLVSGKLSAFSTETLLHYLALLGCNIDICVSKPTSKNIRLHHLGHIAVRWQSAPSARRSGSLS